MSIAFKIEWTEITCYCIFSVQSLLKLVQFLHTENHESHKLRVRNKPFSTIEPYLSSTYPWLWNLTSSNANGPMSPHSTTEVIKLTARHRLLTHVCFMRCGPPYFFKSRQNTHSRQSGRVHGSHFLQRTLRRRLAPGAIATAERFVPSLPPPPNDVFVFRRFACCIVR
jgi:hypothetical protein